MATSSFKQDGAKDARRQSESYISTPLLRALHHHLSASLYNTTCADIRIGAFGNTYALHRIFLVQATFFHSLLNGGFHEAQSDYNHSFTSKPSNNSLNLHFDDPNITRPAFEYCVASLYGAAPRLILPSWSSPSSQYPLTEHVPSVYVAPRSHQKQSGGGDAAAVEGTRDGEMGGVACNGPQHPATPRFLLSLLATSLYLGIPSVASQAMTLIMSSITPFTMSHYLRFALGHGILGAREAKARRDGKTVEVWDWELEGPAWGLAGLAKDKDKNPSQVDYDGVVEKVSSMEIADDDAERRRYEMNTRQSSSTEAAHEIYERGYQGLYYGAYSDKIGEACSCWLLRWGEDVLRLEEDLSRGGEKGLGPNDEGGLLPIGRMPVSESLTADDCPSEVAFVLPPTRPAVWCHPSKGGIPAEFVCSTIASDSFWVREEWDRYDMARRVIALRRSHVYTSPGSIHSATDGSANHANEELEDSKETVQDDERALPPSPSRTRRSSNFSTSQGTFEDDQDEMEYDRLFSDGIYYSHMSFNRLSTISNDVCPHTGLTYAPTNILQSALWAQAELKNVILSNDAQRDDAAHETKAHDDDDDEEQRGVRAHPREGKEADAERELGLISSESEFAKALSASRRRPRSSRAHAGDARRTTVLGGVTPLMQSPSQSSGNAVDGLLAKRYFAVPVDDTVRLGENLSTLTGNQQQNAAKKEADEKPIDDTPTGIAAVKDANTLSVTNDGKRASVSDFFGLRNAVESGQELAKRGLQRKGGDGDQLDSTADEVTGLYDDMDILQRKNNEKSREWTGFEPMRVGVEFFDVDRLPEKQRLYSPSFFYAGSVWNLYVQTVRKPKGLQLGIYLHRQNCSDSLPSPSLPSHTIGGGIPSGVSQTSFMEGGDDSMMFHRNPSEGMNTPQQFYNTPRTPQRPPQALGEGQVGGANRSMGSIFLHAPDTATDSLTPQRRVVGTPGHSFRAAAGSVGTPSSLPLGEEQDEHGNVHDSNPSHPRQDIHLTRERTPQPTPSTSNASDLSSLATPSIATANAANKQLLEVPYLDQRRVLRAYFSIHCPSPTGTSLTKFSSRPDNFSLSQSWGWKSSSLLGSVFLQHGHIGTARSQTSQTFRCVVTMGVV